jgi:hypothetical protein
LRVEGWCRGGEEGGRRVPPVLCAGPGGGRRRPPHLMQTQTSSAFRPAQQPCPIHWRRPLLLRLLPRRCFRRSTRLFRLRLCLRLSCWRRAPRPRRRASSLRPSRSCRAPAHPHRAGQGLAVDLRLPGLSAVFSALQQVGAARRRARHAHSNREARPGRDARRHPEAPGARPQGRLMLLPWGGRVSGAVLEHPGLESSLRASACGCWRRCSSALRPGVSRGIARLEAWRDMSIVESSFERQEAPLQLASEGHEHGRDAGCGAGGS